MDLIIQMLSDFSGVTTDTLRNVFSLVGLTGSIVAPLGIFLALRHYTIKRFIDQITFSTNFFEESNGKLTLKIRNPVMLPMDDVLPKNPFFRFKLLRAIMDCTPEDMFIRMSPSDMDVLQPLMINAYSAEFSEGITAKTLGLPVDEHQLYMAVTFEKDGTMKNQKIRVMIVRREDLHRLHNREFIDSIAFERSHHAYRMVTLRKMAIERINSYSVSADDLKVVRPISVYFRK